MFNLNLVIILSFSFLNSCISAQKEYSSVLLLKEIVQTAKSPFPTLLSQVINACESTDLGLEKVEQIGRNYRACYSKHITHNPLNHAEKFKLFCSIFNSSKADCYTEMRETNFNHRCNDNHTDMFEFTSTILEYICQRKDLVLEQINTTGTIQKYYCYDEPRSGNVELCVRQKSREKYETESSHDLLEVSELPCIDFQIVKQCLESYFIPKCSKLETAKFFQNMLNTVDEKLCLKNTKNEVDQTGGSNHSGPNSTTVNEIFTNTKNTSLSSHSKIVNATITDKHKLQCVDKDGNKKEDVNSRTGSAGDIKVECIGGGMERITIHSSMPLIHLFLCVLIISKISQ